MRVSASYRLPVLLSRAPPEGDRCAPVLAASAAVVSRLRTFSALPATTIKTEGKVKRLILFFLFDLSAKIFVSMSIVASLFVCSIPAVSRMTLSFLFQKQHGRNLLLDQKLPKNPDATFRFRRGQGDRFENPKILLSKYP